jgi:hypothetical protein
LLARQVTRILRRLTRQSATARGHAIPVRAPTQLGSRICGGEPEVVYVLIRAWNRPLYLWACLDSLYRFTRHPCRFVLIDNASTDPLVRSIVHGFERRGMFHAIHWMERNHADNQRAVLDQYRAEMGRYFILVDADVVVEKAKPDWLRCMIDLADSNPQLAALGSALDAGDFIDPDWARRAAPAMPLEQLRALIKAASPERRTPASDADVIDPFPPAGRLLLLRSEAIDRIGLLTGNRRLCSAIRNAGYEVGIATRVRHRHLSLLNFYDYPDYDFANLRRYLGDR